MFMKVTEELFVSQLREYKRAEHFTHEGLVAIFKHITLCEDVHEDVQNDLDIVGVCCDYVEVRHEEVEQMEMYSHCKVIAELGDSTVFKQ